MRRKLCSVAIILLCMVCGQWACSNDSSALSAEEKYAVDTIYNRKIISWRTELDSFCKHQSDTLFFMAVDSLKKERLAEIEMLLNEPTLPE